MAISVSGLASGIDIDGLVESLMEVERRPLLKLEAREVLLEAQISSYGQLSSALAKFQSAVQVLGDPVNLVATTTQSSDESVLSASAAGDAAGGSYAVTVLQTAGRHKLASQALAGGDGSLGSGTFIVASGGDIVRVAVGDTVRTLSDLRDAINAADGDLRASILSTDAGSRLILTAGSEGSAGTLSVSVSDAEGDLALLGGDGFTQVDPARDAVIEVDGFQVTRGSNSIDDVIEGLTLELRDTGEARVELRRSNTGTLDALDAFAAAYNELVQTLGALRNGELAGDNLLVTIESRIRARFGVSFGTGSQVNYLFQAGVEVDRYGVMTVRAGTLSEAIRSDESGLVSMFSDAETGFAADMDRLLQGMLGRDGLVVAGQQGLEARMERLGAEQERIEDRLQRVEERYREQFNRMDILLGKLRAESESLAAQLANLPSANTNRE